MNLKNNRGSIAVFVLVGLLFMSAFLIISFANIANKSKVEKEQLDIIKGIYYKGNDEESYNTAYSYLRSTKNETITVSSESNDDTSVIELNSTYDEDVLNYRIYGNGIKTDIVNTMIGDLISDISNENYGKYVIQLKISNKDANKSYSKYIYIDNPLEENDYIDFKTQKIYRADGTIENIEIPNIKLYEDYTKIEIITNNKTPKIEVEYKKFNITE